MWLCPKWIHVQIIQKRNVLNPSIITYYKQLVCGIYITIWIFTHFIEVRPVETQCVTNNIFASSWWFCSKVQWDKKIKNLLATLRKNTRRQQTGKGAYISESPLYATEKMKQFIQPWMYMTRPYLKKNLFKTLFSTIYTVPMD